MIKILSNSRSLLVSYCSGISVDSQLAVVLNGSIGNSDEHKAVDHTRAAESHET